jgi:hypothetical protein
MVNKELISKIEKLERMPKGSFVFKNNNIYFDHLNLSWLSRSTLLDYGIPVSTVKKFNFFYGQIGNVAKASLKNPVVLTVKEIKLLFKVSIYVSIQEISECIGTDVFNGLPCTVQAVLVSLWRRFGRLTKAGYPLLTMASGLLIRGCIRSAVYYLKDERGWVVESKEFKSQRLKEIKMLESFLGDRK